MLQPKTPEDNAEKKKLRHRESRERKNIQSDFDTEKTKLSMFVLKREREMFVLNHEQVIYVQYIFM